MLPSLIETERLKLVPVSSEHWSLFVDMYQKPKLMKYIADGSVKSPETTKKICETMNQRFIEDGFGQYSLFLKNTNELIGRVGFLRWDIANSKAGEGEDIELGYFLDDTYQGKGYAKEACTKLIEAWKEFGNTNYLVCVMYPENIPSMKLANKLGFKFRQIMPLAFSDKIEVFQLDL